MECCSGLTLYKDLTTINGMETLVKYKVRG